MTVYEVRISDWSSDVCSSDLHLIDPAIKAFEHPHEDGFEQRQAVIARIGFEPGMERGQRRKPAAAGEADRPVAEPIGRRDMDKIGRSEEHTSELQSLMRNSYAVFCLKKKKKTQRTITSTERVSKLKKQK